MSYILAGALATAVGLAAVLGAGLVWLTRKLTKLADQRMELGEAAAGAKAEAARWEAHAGQLESALKDKSDKLLRELAARKKVEEQRDGAIKRLLEHGDPGDVADALRIDLDRLRDLSPVPEVPPGTIATIEGDNED